MKRLFWILVSIAISTGVYYTIRYGLRPKPIPVLNPTRFEDVEQIGIVLYKRLRTDVRAERAVVLGSSPDVAQGDRAWEGFIKAARADREKIVYFGRAPLDPASFGGDAELVPYNDEAVTSGRLVAEVKRRVSAGQLILIHALSGEASHLVADSLTRKLETALQHPLLSLSILRYAVNAAERDVQHLTCIAAAVVGAVGGVVGGAVGDDVGSTSGDGGSGTVGGGTAGDAVVSTPAGGGVSGGEDPLSRLRCAAERVSKQSQRRALDPHALWAAVERHGLKEYLVFIHPTE